MLNSTTRSSASDSTTTSANGRSRLNGAKHTQVQPQQDVIDKPPLRAEPVRRSRSLGLQFRYMRSLVWASGLLARLLFWHYLLESVLGWHAFVERGSLNRWQYYARSFRYYALAMGGVMIKLGQFVSTRVDILPPEITDELAGLQDEVPSVPYSHIRAVIEAEIGPISQHFNWIDETPIAAASLGQVHRAQLLNGDRVVVKVQRPGIDKIVYTDLAALRIIARVMMVFPFVQRRADASALIEEFGRVLLEELSYKNEAYNATRFHDMFKNDFGVYVPIIYMAHSSDHVLTMEDVTSIKINDYAAMEAAGINRRAVADRLIDTYLTQVFRERFFHADPHPGNLFVYPLEPANGKANQEGRPFYLIFVDFGMTGTLTEKITAGMVNTMAAVMTRNPHKLVQSYAELGFLLPDADMARIEEATQIAFDRVWGMSMADLRDMDTATIRDLGKQFNELLYDMPFYAPQDFIYLARTLGILNGMATSLDPDYNVWQELQRFWNVLVQESVITGDGSTPSLESLMTRQGAQLLLETGQKLIRRAVNPTGELVERIEHGNLRFAVEQTPQVQRQLARLEIQERRTTRAILAGSVLICATLFFVNGEIVLALVGYGFSALWFMGIFFGNDVR